MKEKIVVLGAGSAAFTRCLVSDIMLRGMEADLALVDVDPSALEVAERLTLKIAKTTGSRARVTAFTDRRQALRGATAVVVAIAVGGRRAWERDVFVPRKFGIFQPVGDTVMPGGTSRALRMIPTMVAIAADTLDLCPRALFFNFSNPMAPICRAIVRATGARVIGLCHGVHHVNGYLAKTLRVAPSRLRCRGFGINHLTWIREARLGRADAMPALRRVARRRAASQDNPFSWQLFEKFGAFPAVLDRHVTEFFPRFFPGGRYFGRTLGVEAFSFEETIAHGDRAYDRMREEAFSRHPLAAGSVRRFSEEPEQLPEILENIRRGTGRAWSANLPNGNRVPNLPPEAVVEGSAAAVRGGMRLLPEPPFPAALAGTLSTRFQWVETVVEAALEGSRDKFVQALLLDGAVTSPGQADKLADALLAAQAAHLPLFTRP